MTHDDVTTFTREMARLNLAFPKEALSDDTEIVYFDALRDLSIEQVQTAVQRAIRENTWMPKVAELRALVLGAPDDAAAFAWARAYRASLRGFGTARKLDFQDPVLHATVTAMGGWERIARLGFSGTESVDIAMTRKEFVHLYAIYLVRGVPADTPALLGSSLHEDSAPRVLGEGFDAPEDTKALPAAQDDEPFVPDGKAREVSQMIDKLATTLHVPRPRARLALVRSEVTPDDEQEHARRKAEALTRFQGRQG